ncbi:hypothetical protein L484_002849 [Morus notabilis]|uniref:Uncharacterized protein n=1 Tax=Morus notabilis TaxID=981085 RepID=W9SDY7_9ROSA|nr:hypothetical protein L484_002849 [Morus notabilis]
MAKSIRMNLSMATGRSTSCQTELEYMDSISSFIVACHFSLSKSSIVALKVNGSSLPSSAVMTCASSVYQSGAIDNSIYHEYSAAVG